MPLPARRAALAVALGALCGCSEKSAPQPAQPSLQAPAPQPTLQRSDAMCAAPIEASAAREKLRAPAGSVRIGVLAGLKDADDENVAQLKKLIAALVAEKPDVLIADGDLGDNVDEQETLLSLLTDTGLPVLAVAGNREARSDLDAAEAAVRKRGGKLVDLSHTRVVDLGDAVVVGLPGAFERRQLHADGACLYVQRDLDALSSALDRLAAGPPVVLVAAVPPRGQDASALDVSERQNIGDPRLTAVARKAPFGIFGQVWEAGGRAIGGDGRAVPQKTDVPQLQLNPGAADRTPWPMSDGTTASGLAALLTIHGRSAQWQRVEAPK
jgi:hypothetical protein